MIHKRQTDLFNPANHSERHVTVVGLGNIGSHSTIALAKMGIKNFTLYDFDTVELHNTASQSYTNEDASEEVHKTVALSRAITMANHEAKVETRHEAFRGHEQVLDILLIAVDSIQERKNICRQLTESEQNPFIIDGRMGGGQVEVWAQTLSDWEATFSDNPDSDPCSARYISYTSYIIAGAIANTVKRYLQGERLCKRFVMHVDTYDIITQWYATE